jgi:hypothetical protein
MIEGGGSAFPDGWWRTGADVHAYAGTLQISGFALVKMIFDAREWLGTNDCQPK